MRLTRRDRAALAALLDAERSCGGPDSGYAWAGVEAGVTTYHGEREIVAGLGPWRQVEINWRTVSRLIGAGLAEADSYEARWDDVVLTDAGRAVAEAA